MSLEESVHLFLHITQVRITLIVIYRFLQNYKNIRSSFNLGLILFAIAMLMQITISWSMNIFVHMTSEVFELVALLIFLRLILK